MNRKTLGVMAAAAGMSVANLYYVQPLLPRVAAELGMTARAAGRVVTVSQVGYALGLLLLVPLGDAMEKRRMIVIMLALVSVALVAVGLAPGAGFLLAANLTMGFFAITPQLLIPFAASLAKPHERGQVVGTVAAGVLTGVLLARTLSGIVAAWLGWRAVYFLAAVMMLSLAALLARWLPRGEVVGHRHLNYLELQRSLLALIREEPVLTSSSLMGAASFGAFCAFWTVLPFLLAGPAYGYGSAVIGLFGLVGAVGIVVAPLAGRLTDAGRARVAIGWGLLAVLISFLWMAGTSLHLWALLAGILVMDAGATANHISNQSRVYTVRPEARNRVNTVYMVIYFVGGSAGSFAGALGWSLAGWPGLCVVAAAFALFGLAVFVRTRF